MAALIVLLVVALFVLIVLARTVRIIPQARAGVVERLGRYSRTLDAGLTIIVPFVDRLRPLIDLREQVVSFQPQPVITEDNLVVNIDSVIYFQVTDPRAATYEIANYIAAIEQLTVTTLRNVIGGMTLEQTLTSRDQINAELRGVLDEATGKWGIRVNRVELKAIDPPGSIQEAMEKQMRAERLQAALSDVRSRGKLTDEDISKAMRAIRLALLEADVNFQVVKSFTAQVKERALGADVLESLNPGQQVVKIVSDELTQLMGGSGRDLVFAPGGTTVILMAGLQGSGKTTACAKLARHLREEHKKDVALAACDVYRPAAVDQLVKVGQQAGATVYEQGTNRDPVEIAEWALGRAKAEKKDALIVDTSGRLHIDAELMEELAKIKKRTKPHDVLLVVDAMTGQDAVNVAEQFADTANFDGVVMTKLDGDARGGAALSIKAVTGKPILYASTGEKLDAFERFHPDRMAQRILGMGDVMSLIEKVEKQTDEDRAKELE